MKKQGLSSGLRKMISVLLCVCLVGSVLPLQVFASDASPETVEQGDQPSFLDTQNGEVQVEDDWYEAYPYGTFAFGTYQADIGEPGALTQEGEKLKQIALLPVYRLGGTAGRATAIITYAPAVTTDENGTDEIYDYAASGKNDVKIEIERANPLAAYQELGLPEEERDMIPAPAVGVHAETTQDNHLMLSLTGADEAQGYRWQYKSPMGTWRDVDSGDGAVLTLSSDDYSAMGITGWDSLDFRCILTAEGYLLCTVSLRGENFVPDVPLSPIPDDLTVPEEPEYETVEFEDDYDIYMMDLTFAEGETVKYIRVTALDDELPELPEMGMFTIVGCEGGEYSELCNTLTLMVSDDEPFEPCEIGFEVKDITVDREDGFAKATVRRTGGKNYNITVDYATEDITAVAGEDYAAKTGTMSFVGSIDEVTVPIELIANEKSGELRFALILSNVRGGGEDDLCTLVHDRLEITVTGTSDVSKSAGQNLATVLSGSDSVGADTRVKVAEDSLIPASDEQFNFVNMRDSEPGEAEFVNAEPTRSQPLKNKLKFTRSGLGYNNNLSDGYWRDWEIIFGQGKDRDATDAVDYTGNLWFKLYDQSKNKWVIDEAGLLGTVGSRVGSVVGTANKQIDVRVAERSDEDEDDFSSYLEMSTNFKAYVLFEMSKAGHLYDSFEFSSYLREVGTKHRSGSGKSRYIKPNLSLNLYRAETVIVPENAAPGTPLVILDPVSNTVTADWNINGRTDHRYCWWTSSSTNLSMSISEQNKNVWASSSQIKSVPLPLNTDLKMELDLVMAKQWDGSEIDDCTEGMQNDERTEIDIPVFRVHRRVLTGTKEIPVVLYTANDSNEANSGEIKWTALPSTSDLYTNLTPSMTLQKGGVTTNGELYVGSVIQINTGSIPTGFKIPDGGLFLTDLTTQKRAPFKMEKVGNTNSSIRVTLDSDNLTEAQMTHQFQLNILLQREQIIEIDLGPSVGKDGLQKAFEKFAPTGTGTAPIVSCSVLNTQNGVPEPGSDGLYFSTSTDEYLTRSKLSIKSGSVYKTGFINNIQTINFRKDSRDLIVYNGVSYAGNADIKLTTKDLTNQTIHFTYYHRDFLKSISPMTVNIIETDLYYDGDGDGKISGSVNQETGLFEPSGADTFVGHLSGDYPESTFKPVEEESRTIDEDGNIVVTKYSPRKIHQYFLKVTYTMRPRSLIVPVGASESDKAQVLPAFLSAATKQDAVAALTEEQRSYRYIKGANTDDHLMYGAAASEKSFIDIPLGGDLSTITYQSVTTAVRDKDDKIVDAQTEKKYTWNPDFLGSLIVPFASPDPVVNTDNITGEPVCMAGETIPVDSQGNFVYNNTAALAKMNGFLGAFVGRSTFALGVQPQVKTIDNIKSLGDISPETMTVGNVATTPNADSVMNPESGGDPGSTSGDTPGDDAGYPEFGADMGTSLPSLELELGDYATLIMDGYQVGFAIGIPIYKYEDTKYSGSERESVNGNTTTHSHVDEDGNQHEKTTVTDDKTKTKTETEKVTKNDPTDTNKRTIEVTTVETDEKGNQTYKKETVQQERKKDKNGKETWEDVGNATIDTTPPTPSQQPPKTNGEQFKERCADANSGLATLAGFISACKSRSKDQLKEFWNGAWEDDSLKNAKNGNCTSTKVEVAFTVQLSLMFEYNPIDNCHYFKSAGISATLGIELSAQHRFSALPLVYVYIKLGISVELSVSLSCTRKAKLGNEITQFKSGSLVSLSQKKPVVFELDMKSNKGKIRGFHIDLLGSVYMEVYDNPALSGKPLTTGTLSGDGSEKEVLFKAYKKVVYIRLTPLRGKTVVAEKLRPVVGASSKVVFDGLNITPSIELEVGIGVGVELLKFEIFVKTSIAITITMGGYLEETERYEGFYISSFEWGLSVGFNVTALFFNYSQQCIAIAVTGEQHGTGGYFSWEISATAVDGNFTLWTKDTYTSADGKHLDGEPEPPDGVNIGPEDPAFVFRNANGTAVTPDGFRFPDDCDWDMMSNVAAWRWDGGDFKGEIPQDADFCIADKDNVKVTFSVPEKADTILVYFDGTISYTVANSGLTKTNVKKSPVKIKVSGGSSGDANAQTAVELKLKKGTKLDRYEFLKTDEEDGAKRSFSIEDTISQAGEQSLIRVSSPTDISDTQSITRAGSGTRAIPPTGTSDFELSGVNTSGDAKKLVGGLANGYSYKLFTAGNEEKMENYILYPYSVDHVTQLVMSKVVVTGDLSTVSGLNHPTDSGAEQPYLKVDNDSFGDLDYNVSVDGSVVTVVWSAYADGTAAGSSVDAARNVVVKRATIDLESQTAFTSPEILTSGTGKYRFMPVQCGNSAIWAESDGDGSGANEKLAAYLIATNAGLTQQMLSTGTAANASLAAPVYRYVIQSDLNEIYGKNNKLVASNGAVALINGEHIENIETGVIDGNQIVLYSTTQTAYFDADSDTPVTVEPSAFNARTELGLIRRLYIRTLTSSGWGDAHLLQTVVDFDGCNSDNIEDCVLQDGVYINNSLAQAQADPYFSNFKFLRANLEAANKPETVMLYEMGGNSYLMRQEDVISLIGGGEAKLIPIFEQTTGSDVTIGSDGENLAVVYTASVPGNLSNAIYIAWWDRNIKGWGSPNLLAMRNLQVYEDGVKDGMSPEDMELAYLGKLSTRDGNTGSMDVLTFSDLQMSTRKVKKTGNTEGKQLLVLTVGSLQAIKDHTYDLGEGRTLDSLVTSGPASLNFYAIAFGAGEQALGRGRLSLANYDFGAGNHLVGTVEFMNTGTTAVRGSGANPILIQLKAKTDKNGTDPDILLAEWKLKNSIRSGSSVNLSFKSAEIETTLPVGTVFYLTVAEDPGYIENTFTGRIDNLLTVEQRPDLSISGFNASLATINKTNNTAELQIEMTVANSGNTAADNVYVQFAYDTGRKDSAGMAIYDEINITGSVLNTEPQEPIATRGSITGSNPANGVYMLKDAQNKTNLDAGYSRRVSGKLVVPISCFVTEEDISGLHLRAEAYSGFDSPDFNDGLYSSDHNEYNSINNISETAVKHRTDFEVPDQINTALGNTLTLPIDYYSTSPVSDIVITEISDGTPGWEPRMGICYYDASRRVIVAAPNATAQALIAANKKPTGILQIKDTATNSIAAITYTVGSMSEGVNIYRDDASYRFHNAGGASTDLFASSADDPGWLFPDAGVEMLWNGSSGTEIPMNNDLTMANQDGAYLEFSTVADKLTIYYKGSIKVWSSFNNRSETFTSDTATHVTVEFNNNSGAQHTVRITAQTKGTLLDRYVPSYKTNTIPPTDPDAPQIFWCRSFPQTASLKTGSSVTIRCYVMDESGLGDVKIDGTVLSGSTTPRLNKVDDNVWYFDYTFKTNEPISVRATDGAGNSSGSNVSVDWFNDVVSSGSVGTAPGLKSDDLHFVNSSGQDVPTTGTISTAPKLKSNYALADNETSSAYLFTDGIMSGSALEKNSDGTWQAVTNGWYMVLVERGDGTWAKGFKKIANLDLSAPQLSVTEGDGKIEINGSDNGSIKSITVNGYALEVSGNVYSGSFETPYSGTYKVVITDNGNNKTEKTVTMTVPISFGSDAVVQMFSCANNSMHGAVTVDPEQITGGAYDAGSSQPQNNVYKAKYSAALVASGASPAQTDYISLDSGTKTFDNLAPGDYDLYFADSSGTAQKWESVIRVAHPDNMWAEPTYDWSADYSTVTATHVCLLDSTHTESETVSTTSEVKTPAKCTEDGVMTYTAVFTNPDFWTQKKDGSIDSTGHNYGAWKKLDANKHQRICANDPTHTETAAHKWDAGKVTTPATCAKEGVRTFTCADCGATKTQAVAKDPANHTGGTEIRDAVNATCGSDGYSGDTWCKGCGVKLSSGSKIPATGNHSWNSGVITKSPACTTDGVKTFTCTVCSATKTETVAKTGHKLTKTAAKAATCTQAGNVEYYTCSVCKKTFSDAKGTKEITDVTVKAAGHKLTKTAAKAATCTQAGNVEYYTCSVCKKTFSDANGTKEIADVTVKAAGHKLTKTAAKAATCTADGNVEYYTCSVCKKIFSDAKGTKEITNVTAKATGHKLTKTAEKAPTCTQAGNVEYYVCSVCKKTFSDAKGTKEIKDVTVKAAGHKLTKTAAKAATCTQAGNVEYYVCSACKKTFSDAKGTKEITDVTVKATGHSFGEWTVVKKPTIEKEGTESRKCSKCGAEETRPVAKLPLFTPGDVDNDGKVLAADARYALRAAVGLDDTAEGLDFSSKTNRCFLAADITGDEEIFAEDARLILRAAVGLCDLNDPATW